MQRDPGIRRKCQPVAQPWTLGRTDIEPIADQYAGLRIHMTKMLQRHRYFGKLRDPEEFVVRGQLRYLADVPAELRRQPGRGFIGATGLREHVAKNNTRFSAHGLLDVGGPVSARGPAGVPGLVLHQRMVRPKDPGICSEGRHRASPAFLTRSNRRRETATCTCGHVQSVTHLADINTTLPREGLRRWFSRASVTRCPAAFLPGLSVAVLTATRKIIPCISRMPVSALSAGSYPSCEALHDGYLFPVGTCPVTARTMQGMARVRPGRLCLTLIACPECP